MSLSDQLKEARDAVNLAIDALNEVPRTFGGHRSGERTSVIECVHEGFAGLHVIHDDGRIGRAFYGSTRNGMPVLFRGEYTARMVPTRKLRWL